MSLRTLGMLHLVYGCYQATVGVIMGLVFAVGGVLGALIALAEGDEELLFVTAFFFVMALFVVGVVALAATPKLLAGWGLLKDKPWARVMALIAAAFSLFSFPFGMILAICTFVTIANAPPAGIRRSIPA